MTISHDLRQRMPMELSQLRTFRVVAETLNFTRAAERLGLTQSAVSHQIKSLETELGEPLFIRAKRGVKLSQAGPGGARAREPPPRRGRGAARARGRPARPLRPGACGRRGDPGLRPSVRAALRGLHARAPGSRASRFRTTVEHRPDRRRHPERRGRRGLRVAARLLARACRSTELFEDELLLVVGHAHPLAGRDAGLDRRPPRASG